MNTTTTYYLRQMTAWLAGVALALAMACASKANAVDVTLPGGRVTTFSDPPTPLDLSRAGTTAANLLMYHTLCGRLPTKSMLFLVELVKIAGPDRVEVMQTQAMGVAARNGLAAYCVYVRGTLPREVFE